jgi:hypothetical protein
MATRLADQGEFVQKAFQMMQKLSRARHTLIPPTGYHVTGIAGSCGDWLDSFQLIVTR